MSRKDYVAAAEVIRAEMERAARYGDEEKRYTAESAVIGVATGMADVFARDNARFDRARFYAACGIR